jgi:hypothetical protein
MGKEPLDLKRPPECGGIAWQLVQSVELTRERLVSAGSLGAVQDLETDRSGRRDHVSLEQATPLRHHPRMAAAVPGAGIR